LVSIVTPTLQRAEYLERTLRSVCAQTYPKVEHIVVDGGSTDGTLDLLRRYEGTYNLRWVSEPDRGMYDAINKGLRMASGEIVAYLNSDDLYFPWTIGVAVKAFAGDPRASVVFGDLIRVDDIRGRVVPVFIAPFARGVSAAFGNLSQPAVFFRRSVVHMLAGFDPGLKFVADADFWLRASDRFTFVRVDEFLALELWHATTLSTTSRDKMAVENDRMRRAYQRGVWATRLGRFAAYVRWHWWSGRRWLTFVRATRGGPGWEQSIAHLGPSIDSLTGALGWFPSKGGRLRSSIRWTRDPLEVAMGDADG
jgi:glycosyltransferase involved in cell wall biosynthesis